MDRSELTAAKLKGDDRTNSMAEVRAARATAAAMSLASSLEGSSGPEEEADEEAPAPEEA